MELAGPRREFNRIPPFNMPAERISAWERGGLLTGAGCGLAMPHTPTKRLRQRGYCRSMSGLIRARSKPAPAKAVSFSWGVAALYRLDAATKLPSPRRPPHSISRSPAYGQFGASVRDATHARPARSAGMGESAVARSTSVFSSRCEDVLHVHNRT